MSEFSALMHPDSGASAEERNVLRAADAALPPPGAEDRVWLALGAALGPAAMGVAAQSVAGQAAISAVGTAASAGAAKTGAWLAVKIAAVSLVGSAVVGGAAHLVYRSVSERPVAVSSTQGLPSARPPARPAEPAAALAAPPELDETEHGPARTEDLRVPPAKRNAGSPVAPAIALSTPPTASVLEHEARLLAEARAQLKRGDVSGASDTLEALRTSFPSGALTQEREVVAIEILGKSGRADEADRRARAFLATYPDSPHAAKVRRALLPVR